MVAGERGVCHSRRDLIRGATLAACGSVLALTPGIARAESIELDTCRTIHESGEYVLTEDLTAEGDCLRVAAESVRIEGNDHRLTGDDTGGGLVIDAATDRLGVDVEVTNLAIEGFEYGVEFEAAPARLALSGVDIGDAGQGIRLRNVPGTVTLDIRESSIHDCHSALFGGFDDRVSVVDSTLRDNVGQAVHLGEGAVLESTHSVISDNGGGLLIGPHGTMHLEAVSIEANENAGIGLWMAGTCEVLDSTVRDNGGPGLEVIEGMADVHIADSTFEGNEDSAVLIHGEEVEVTVDRSEIRDNDGGVTATAVSDSTLVGNDRYGIRLRSVDEAPIRAFANEIRATSGPAVVVLDGDGTITENTIVDNLFGVAILDDWSAELVIDKNNFDGNSEYGIRNRSGVSVEASCNYWGDPTGPAHADNPAGGGDRVSDDVVYMPWSIEPVVDGETDCRGGIEATPTASPTPDDHTPTPDVGATPVPDDHTPTPALSDPIPTVGAGGAIVSLLAIGYLLKRRIRDDRPQDR